MLSLECTHLGGHLRGQRYRCAKHHKVRLAACLGCPDWQARPRALELAPPEALQAPPPAASPPRAAKYRPTLQNRTGQELYLKDFWAGSAAFVLCGGPSLRKMDLSLLGRRGVLILAINNSPAALPAPLRPHIWLHSDATRKFHLDLWRDPAVLKFTPRTLWKLGRDGEYGLRRRSADGQLRQIEPRVAAQTMPAAVGFERNHDFDPARWLDEPTINNGQSDKKPGAEHWPHTINTMFVGLKLAWWLGFRRLYLLGCDFRMDPARPYAFDQGKSRGAVRSNNAAFASMCAMFDGLVPYFERAGLQVWNCTPGSCLWSFPRLDLDEAIRRETDDFEQTLNTTGYYDGCDKPKPDHSSAPGGPG